MADLLPYVVAVLVIVGALLLLGFRRRILLRIGVRNFLRRKSQVALAVAGLFVGTSIISGALVMGDSLGFTARQLVLDEFGLVDEIVWLPNVTAIPGYTGGASYASKAKDFFPAGVYTDLANRSGEMPDVDGIAPRILVSASVRDLDSGFVEPSGRLVGFDPSADFDAFVVAGQSYAGRDLMPGEAVVNARAADHMGAQVGDHLKVFTERGNLTVTVRAIAEEDQKGAFLGGANVFVRLSEVQVALNVTGQVNGVLISNAGDERSGLTRTDAAVAEVRARIPAGLTVDPAKRTASDGAEAGISWITQIFGALGLFTILAGILLIMNIFVVLAEERKGEMGMSRALGMRRSHLTETFVFEGMLYALAANAVGAVAGLATGGAVILGFGALFGDQGFAPIFHFEWSSLIIAFALGFIVTMVVVALASWRVSRLNIVRAIRSIAEPLARKGTRRQWALGALLAVAGVVATWQATAQEWPLLAVAGPAMLAFGLAGVAQRLVGGRAAYTATAVALSAWILYPPRTSLYVKPNEFPIEAFVVAGMVLVLCIVVVVMMNSGLLLAGLTRLAGRRKRLRPVMKAAVSYPMARKGRTGLALAMFALVVFIITLVSMFSSLFFGNVQQFTADNTGGYDIGARAGLRPPGGDFYADFRAAPASQDVAYFAAFNGSYAGVGNPSGRQVPYPVVGVPAYFGAQNRFPFQSRLAAYETDRAVWDALAADPNVAVFDGGVSNGFSPVQLHTGDRVQVTNALGDARTVTVIGTLREVLITGMFVGDGTARDVYFAEPAASFLFKVAPGQTPGAVARELERDFVSWGLDATVLKDLIDQVTRINLSFIGIVQAFLALGLIVGVAGLGVVTMRNVVERRNEIGTLRAIGFRRSMVLKYLLIENAFVSLLGIAIGIAAGIVFAYLLFTQVFGFGDQPFVVPWFDLLVIAAIAYAAGLLSTFPPSRKASRMPPAEALRMVE